MHAMVTGAGGLIGRAVVKRARAEGWRVTGVARRPCPEAERVADLRQPVERWPAPDVIIHLAGGYAGAEARELEAADLTIAQNVFAWGRRVGVRRWVFASAAEVYGRVRGVATEEWETRPLIPYGHVKLEVERMLKEMVAEMARENVDCGAAILRIGEVYGPGSRLLAELARRLTSGFCPWPGSGNVPVSFVHVDDVAAALVRAAADRRSGVTVYNVADDEPSTWRAFAEKAAKLLRTRGPLFLPSVVAYGYMTSHRLKCRILGREPVLTKHALQLLTTEKALSAEKIRMQFRFTPRFPSIDSGLEASLDGLSHHG